MTKVDLRRSMLESKNLVIEAVEIPSAPHLDERGEVLLYGVGEPELDAIGEPAIDDDGDPVTGEGKPCCTYYVRRMTLKARQQLDKKTVHYKGGGKPELDHGIFRAELLVRCLCDEKGKLLFTPQDVELLEDSVFCGEHVVRVALRLNGLDKKPKNS